MQMMFALPTTEYLVSPVLLRLLINYYLHADHEQNCSTSTVRVVGSSHASLYASVSAGIAAPGDPSWWC